MDGDEKMRKLVTLTLVVALALAVLSGCGNSKSETVWNSTAPVKIAVIGSAKDFEDRKDLLNGMDYAIASHKNISYTLLDTEGSYDKAVNIGNDVIADSSYTIAAFLGDPDTADILSYNFSAQNKPILLLGDVNVSTVNRKDQCSLFANSSAGFRGASVGEYLMKLNLHWLGAAHSNDPTDMEFINGIQGQIEGSTTNFLQLDSKIQTLMDLREFINMCKGLGVDTTVIAYRDVEWAFSTVAFLRKTGFNPGIVLNTVLTTKQLTGNNNTNIDGVMLPSEYPVDANSAKFKEFAAAYSKNFGQTATHRSVQGYDLMCLIAQRISGTTSARNFIESIIKTPYEGVSAVAFSAGGQLEPSIVQVFVVKGGVVTSVS